VRIFPSREARLRLVSALTCQEHSEEWITGRCYLDMVELKESHSTVREVEEVVAMEQ
jgi:hypothetical protein